MIPGFEIFGKTVSVYMILSLAGALVAGAYACYAARMRRHNDNDMIVLLLVSSVGVYIGSHLLYGITNLDYLNLLFSVSHKLDFLAFMRYLLAIFGGSVFYGGLIGGLFFGYIYLRRSKLNKADFTDIASGAIPLMHTFGRVGCFLSGCCYGIECKTGFVYNHSPIPEANGITRFPIQLTEALFNLILFFVFAYFYKKEKFKSYLLLMYLIIYPVGRFIFEFFRGDEYRGFIFGLSTSQFISIILIIFSVTVLTVRKYRDGKSIA